jgi:hypothetical protein
MKIRPNPGQFAPFPRNTEIIIRFLRDIFVCVAEAEIATVALKLDVPAVSPYVLALRQSLVEGVGKEHERSTLVNCRSRCGKPAIPSGR